jgi:protein SCO1
MPRQRATRFHHTCLRTALAFVVVTTLVTAGALPIQAHESKFNALAEVDFVQKLNEQVPLDLRFQDETGKWIQLRDYFEDKPVILSFAYYECPTLCPLALDGLVVSLRQLTFALGEQFDVITVSINPSETPEMAAAKKANYSQRYGRPGADDGWYFLTGEHESIDQLTEAVGFRYTYDSESAQFAHAAGIVVLTPQGKVARYYFGIQYPTRDLQLGLVEASSNKVGSLVDQLLLRCYRYDPTTGKYTLAVMTLVRLVGLATILGLAFFLFRMFRRERHLTNPA